VSDYISVLYLGTLVAQLETKQTNYNDVVAYITGIKSDTIPVEVLEEEAVS
jgi:D-xylose transport system ATP-binding protein